MDIASHYIRPVTDCRTGHTWSAASLDLAVSARAQRFENHRGGRIALAHGGTPALVVDLLACWRSGATALVLDPSLTDSELVNILHFAHADALVRTRPPPESGWTGVHVAPGETPRQSGSSGQMSGDVGLDAPALVLFTSGTTGTPKGVVLTHRALLARVSLNQAAIETDALQRALCVLPAHFGHGLIGNMLTPLAAGGHLYLYSQPSAPEMSALPSVIDEHAITFMSSVPSLWRTVEKLASPPKRDTLARVHIGSAPLSGEQWEQVIDWLGTRDVVNTYGITEAANWIAGASARTRTPSDGCVGRMWGGRACILDRNTGHPLPDGETGDIAVHTPALFQDYLHQPELTERVLRNGWFYTGDVGRMIQGDLFITGRSKNEINRAGLKVHPEEIDSLLERHPDVAEACTFGLADPVSGEIVAAAVSPLQGAQLEHLTAWCRQRIRRECVPEKWFVVDTIPKTDRGKINRDRVRDHCLGGQS